MLSSPVIGARHVPDAVPAPSDVEREIAWALKPIGSGVLLPLFSLPSYFGQRQIDCREFGMGDTGPAAREFVLRLEDAGQRFWALLPLGPTDKRNCPYRTDSGFAISLNTVSPVCLLRDGWITEEELVDALPEIQQPNRVPLGDDAVFHYRRSLLVLAYERFVQVGTWREQFEAFLREEADWLDDYAVYKAIEAICSGRWSEWPVELRDAEPAAVERFTRSHASRITREKFFQFIAQHYFVELRDFAESHGVRLIGDAPAYSMYASADVWANRPVFELDDEGRRTLVAGAPPDNFAPHGQAWNHPMYRWDELATVAFLKKKYARWRRLLGDGFLRDDHIIGKITPWGYWFGTPPAGGRRIKGRYLGNAFFDALLEEMTDLRRFLIGEDLGSVTDETAWLMKHYRFTGMKVLQFIAFNDGPPAIDRDPHTPGNYPDHDVLFLGTHDAPLARQWWRRSLNDDGRRHLAQYVRRELESDVNVTDANVAAVLTEVAMTHGPHMVIHRLADLIVNKDGSVGLVDAQINDPVLGGDPDRWKEIWSWRLAPEAFGRETVERLRRLTKATNRLSQTAIRRCVPLVPVDEEVRLAAALLRGCADPGAAWAVRWESMARDGFVRRVPLAAGILSAVYRPVDGETYLVLSDHAAVGDYASPAQRAVSIVRAFEAHLVRENGQSTSPLDSVCDEVLVDRAEELSARIEDELQCLVAVSPDGLREEMIRCAGILLDPDARPDELTTPRLTRMNVSPAERAELARRYRKTWTDLWVTYQDRGVARENIVAGILAGDLHGAGASLRGLRWCLAEAFADELAGAVTTRDGQARLISAWAGTIELKAVEAALFSFGQPAFAHRLDDSQQAEGLSGILGLLRKARRKGQNLGGYREGVFDYADFLVRQAGGDPASRDALLALLGQLRSGAGLRGFEAVLGMLERILFARLAEVKRPSSNEAAEEFPSQIDLQVHSYHSDCGCQSVPRIVYEAYRRGLKAIAITDHQTLEGVPQAVEIGRLLGVEVVPAVELYSGIRREDGRVHERRDVLVYFPDVEAFLAWHAAGLDDETWSLFNDGWNRSVDSKHWGDVPVKRVTDWARARGGVSVCAHPALLSIEKFHRENWSYDAFERFFFDTGLAGIEICHRKLPFDENTVRFVPLTREFNRRHPDNPIVFTMGTDAHKTKDIGRGNLTQQAVAFMAEGLAPGDNPPASLRRATVDQLQQTAARIAAHMPLYQLRAEILSNDYPGTDPLNRPLHVICPDDNTPSKTIIAGIKSLAGKLVIIAVNRGCTEQFEGKDWGVLNITDAFEISNEERADYLLRDLLTGETFRRTGADLHKHGLRVGLLPCATQFLALDRP